MKKWLFIVSFLFSALFVNAQELFLENLSRSVLIGSIPNTIRLVAKNPQKFALTVDNGKIEKSGSDGRYLIYPKESGQVTVKIKNKKNGNVTRQTFRVRELEFYAFIPNSKIRLMTLGDSPKLRDCKSARKIFRVGILTTL